MFCVVTNPETGRVYAEDYVCGNPTGALKLCPVTDTECVDISEGCMPGPEDEITITED
jgi:hypothetical protein